MKKILLLQYRTDESREHEQLCLINKLGITSAELDVRSVILREELPSLEQLREYRGVIGGASGQFNITDLSHDVQKSIERTYPLMEEIIQQDMPYLGICFGHQVLAHLFGGRVERDCAQAESGSSKIMLTYLGIMSPLYETMDRTFYAVNGHKESVVELPRGAQLLAISQRCQIQSYQIKRNIFATQFHPELDLEDVRFRLTLRPEYCLGRTVDEIMAEYEDVSLSARILHHFRGVMEREEGK